MERTFRTLVIELRFFMKYLHERPWKQSGAAPSAVVDTRRTAS
jgi:hypothetical protein